MTENELATIIVDRAFQIHKTLGPGLFESVYEEVLAYELLECGFKLDRQQPINLIYKGKKLDIGFRADLIVNDKIILEIKSVEELAPVHHKQLLTYLRLSHHKLGLLLNFNVALIKDGIKRFANGL